MKIAYLGPKGTFSEEAAVRYFIEDNVEPIMYSSIFEVLEAVDEGKVDKGIVPIENALGGRASGSIAIIRKSRCQTKRYKRGLVHSTGPCPMPNVYKRNPC